MLEKANKILRAGSVAEIQEFLPELVQEFCRIDAEAGKAEQSHEIRKIEVYVNMKREKKDPLYTGEKYSDKDIDIIAKRTALQEFGDSLLNRKLANHYKLYIQQLSQAKIDRQVENKALREGVGF
jgi:hypothetical protein